MRDGDLPLDPAAWRMRAPATAEFGLIGDLLCDAYSAAGLDDDGGAYQPLMRDVAARVADPRARVLVAEATLPGGAVEIIGTLALCGYGSEWTRVCQPGEFEFRMLAVRDSWRRAGVAAALINACDDLGADLGLTTSIACAWEGNAPAKTLFDQLGFARLPQRDHHYSPDERLEVFGRPASYCGQCGRSRRAGSHASCDAAATLEPPRYCTRCRRRMKVQVLPTGWLATCSRHGETRATQRQSPRR